MSDKFKYQNLLLDVASRLEVCETRLKQDARFANDAEARVLVSQVSQARRNARGFARHLEGLSHAETGDLGRLLILAEPIERAWQGFQPLAEKLVEPKVGVLATSVFGERFGPLSKAINIARIEAGLPGNDDTDY